MSTQPIEHKGYGYTLKQSRKPHEDVDFPLGPEQSKKRQEESGEQGGGLRARILAILSEVPKSESGRLSFQNILDHRDVLEKVWNDTVARDLAAGGVDMSQTFSLVFAPGTGSVTSSTDHPDKIKIDQYFASNPDMVDDFEHVLQLGKLVDVAERKLAPNEMGQTLRSDAMAWWYQSNMDGASLFAGGGTVFGTGASAYKSLDILV